MDLIKIERNEDYGLVVSSRTIASELEKQHSDVVKKIKNVLESGTESFPVQYMNRGKESTEHLLTKDGFVLLVMNYVGYNDFKRSYINKFNEMEKQLNSITKKKMLLADLFDEDKMIVVQAHKELVRLETAPLIEKIALDEPKVEYHDKVLDTDSSFTTTQIAKEVEMTARSLNIVLEQEGIQFKQSKQWMLRAKYQDMGLVKTRTYVTDCGISSHATVWTEKGRQFIQELLLDI